MNCKPKSRPGDWDEGREAALEYVGSSLGPEDDEGEEDWGISNVANYIVDALPHYLGLFSDEFTGAEFVAESSWIASAVLALVVVGLATAAELGHRVGFVPIFAALIGFVVTIRYRRRAMITVRRWREQESDE